MSDAVILGLFTLIGTLTSILVSGFVFLKLGHVQATVATKDALEDVRTKIDGRMTDLLEAVEGKAVAQIGQAAAEGKAAGVLAEQARTAEPQK